MQRFCFRLSKSEELFRDNIDASIIYNPPETFLFFKNYSKGLSFTHNGDIIKGVYLQSSDKESDGLRHGASIRARFHGRLLKKDDGIYFSGWIYPDPIGFAFVMYTFLMFLIYSETVLPKLFAAATAIAFFYGYISLISRCFAELSFMTTGE